MRCLIYFVQSPAMGCSPFSEESVGVREHFVDLAAVVRGQACALSKCLKSGCDACNLDLSRSFPSIKVSGRCSALTASKNMNVVIPEVQHPGVIARALVNDGNSGVICVNHLI